MFVSSLGRTRRDALGRLPRSLSPKALQLYDSPTKARAPEGHPSLSGATAQNGSECDSMADLVRSPQPCEDLRPAGRMPAMCSAPHTGHRCSGPSVGSVLQMDRYKPPWRVKLTRDFHV